jgi:hypothetical protein
MTFKPSQALSPGPQYLAQVGTGARDPAGNALASSTWWQFTTAVAIGSGNLVANPSFESSTGGWGTSGTLTRTALNGAPHGAYVVKAAWTSGAVYSVNDSLWT